MNLNRDAGGFKKILLITPLLLIVVLGIINTHYILKASKLTQELKNQEVKSDKFLVDNAALKNDYIKLQSDYSKLQKDLEKTVEERENYKAQFRSLLKERDRVSDLEQNLEEARKGLEGLEKEKQDLIDRTLELQAQIKDLEAVRGKLNLENEQLKQTLAEEREKSGITRIRQENTAFKKENEDLDKQIRMVQAELGKTREDESRAKAELKVASEKLERLNKDYAEAVKKNKLFEQKVTESPAKFAELARQNRSLIKDTANMHYNLGVFYMKQKEYSRATAELEKAIELSPDDAYAHFNLGYIYAEYLVNRPKAIAHFQKYLRFAKKDDKDVDWVRKYILTWESWQGEKPIE